MNWLAKAFSKLAHVSVRTIHHYDDIGLLKPSLRSSGNYRLYSEDDLFRLQCITALKSFGFNLQQIKLLLQEHGDVASQLLGQKSCLVQQIASLHHTVGTIDRLVEQAHSDGTIPWPDVVTLLEGYRMSNDLTNSWAGRVFSPDQIDQFAKLRKKYTEEQMRAYEQRWNELIERINKALDQGLTDPASAQAQAFADEWATTVDEVYGSTPELKSALFNAYKYNKIPDAPFDQRLWKFLEEAAKHRSAKKA